MLHTWKAQHETAIRQLGINRKFDTSTALKQFVTKLLTENHMLWQQLGPSSDTALSDPGSNLHFVWQLRKLDKILPNNQEIVNAVEANSSLLSAADLASFHSFKIHAQAFEAHQYRRVDSYPRFPKEFAAMFIK